MEGMKPVKIYSCADRVDADMITETLNDRGIPAYSESKGSGDYMNIYMGASMFGNDIYVNEKDADRAKEIVAALTLSLEGREDAEDADIPARVLDKRIRVVRIISLIAAVLIVAGAVMPSLINIFFG
ncbi:MAG TPA: DUF2007 domain-containing protein [Candidatus Mediterraneibacter faecavium]|uniref:DUF2007 domain-containing protein n=1 Tax=Candidatus Mediterraneibacter faecavium TaxID=2838668 RepID=A0A9D2QB59_9FIRM|nr:DUF2007 domain-containing protein [Candidatus Mediterraneibacter faecavium]